jgi:hypothetical protein
MFIIFLRQYYYHNDNDFKYILFLFFVCKYIYIVMIFLRQCYNHNDNDFAAPGLAIFYLNFEQ